MSSPTAPAVPGFRSTTAALVQALQSMLPDQTATVGWGVVVAVTTPTVSVQVRAQAGQIDNVACLGEYASTAQVNDLVALLEWPTETGEDRLVLGGTSPLTMLALYSGASAITIKNNGSEIEIGGPLLVDGAVTASGLVVNGVPQFNGPGISSTSLVGFIEVEVSGTTYGIPFYS